VIPKYTTLPGLIPLSARKKWDFTQKLLKRLTKKVFGKSGKSGTLRVINPSFAVVVAFGPKGLVLEPGGRPLQGTLSPVSYLED
jgi:hypothetical protein